MVSDGQAVDCRRCSDKLEAERFMEAHYAEMATHVSEACARDDHDRCLGRSTRDVAVACACRCHVDPGWLMH